MRETRFFLGFIVDETREKETEKKRNNQAKTVKQAIVYTKL